MEEKLNGCAFWRLWNNKFDDKMDTAGLFLIEAGRAMGEQEPLLLMCPAFFKGLYATYRVLNKLVH